MLMPVRLRRDRPGGEEGIALVTAVLVMMVCTIVVAAIMQLATHTAQRSGLARDRTAALNAAEAGIQAELSAMSTTTWSCPTTAAPAVQLPNQTVPTAWYVLQPSPTPCLSGSPTATIVATGYVPQPSTSSSTITLVAHVNRTQGAPVSGGANNNVRPYNFPDALFTDGTLKTHGGILNLYGSGGSVPNLTANGAISIGARDSAGSLLGGRVNGQSTVNVWASQIGGPVTGTTVGLTGPATGGLTVQGGTSASPTLANTTLNGPTNLALLPLTPLGQFTNDQNDIGTTLGVGTAPVGTCPSSSTTGASNFYDTAFDCSAQPYAPTTYSPPGGGNGVTVLVVHGDFTVTVPPTAVGGQLYVIDSGGDLTIAGTGSTLPVFAFTDGDLKLSGTLAGQFAAHQIDVTGASTTVTFTPPATPMPDISFPVGYSSPTNLANGPNPYVGTVTYQYQCPGANAC